MDLDATLSSHPIVQPVDTPDQITSIFDAISYAKVGGEGMREGRERGRDERG